MYHFIGYTVKQNDTVVHFASTRAQAQQFCAQQGIPHSGIAQVFEFRTPVYTPPAQDVEDAVEPNPTDEV